MMRDLSDFCARVSLQDITIQCDNEPGILSIAHGVEKMRLQNGLKTKVRTPLVGQPKSNGRAERAVRTLKEQSKTLTEMIKLKSGYQVLPGSALVSIAAWLYNKFAVLSREKTTAGALAGEAPYRGVLVSFGEGVLLARQREGGGRQTASRKR